MNFIQRAFAYLARKKGKTAGLFLVIFLPAVFLVSCFGILRMSKRLEEEIRVSVGAALFIRANAEVSVQEDGGTQVKENHVRITEKEIGEVMGTGEIRYCNPINYGFAKSDAIQFIPGERHTDESNMGRVTALRFSALAVDFAEETAVLTEGRHIRPEDRGKILISRRLAEANGIGVGDRLTLAHARPGESDGAYIDEIPVKTAFAEVRVSGIYERKVPEAPAGPTAGVADNEIYASLDVLEGLGECEPGIYTGEVGFYITDPAALKDVVQRVRALESVDWTTHFIRTNDFQYSRIEAQLSSLGGLAKALLILAAAVGGLILTLLLTMRMRGRMQEAGILLSVGISKGQIMAGLLLEVLLTAAAAFLLSYVVSACLVNGLCQGLLHGREPKLLNDQTLAAGGASAGRDWRFGGPEALILYLCQLLVTAASTFASSGMILRLKPKEILSRFS